MTKNFMDEGTYKPQSRGASFKPVDIVDIVPAMQQEQTRQLNSMKGIANDIARNNEIRQQNAQGYKDTLSALGRFSETAMKFAEQRYKQTQEDQATSDMYNALTGGRNFEDAVDIASNQESARGESEAEQVTQAQTEVEEQTNDISLGETVRQNFTTPAANNWVSEKAALMKAQVTYSPFMSSFLNSNKEVNFGNGVVMTVREAVASGDPSLIAGAVEQGRYEFIKQNQLYKANKRNFVKMLAQTMINADATLTNAVTTAAIKANRDETKSILEGRGYQIAQSTTPSTVAPSFRNLSDLMWKSGAYATRSSANEAAVDSMISGLKDRGDVDGLRELLTTEKIEGNAGTQLQNQYAEKINKAILEADGIQDNIIDQNIEDVEAGMYQALGTINPDTPDYVLQRDRIIEDAAKAYESLGGDGWKKARELRSQRDDLSTVGANERNNAELERDITDGSVTTVKEVEDQYRRGMITRAQRDKRISQVNEKNDTKTPTNSIASKLVTTFSKRFGDELGNAVGLKKDANGNFLDFRGSLISAGDAQLIKGQASVELKIIANEILRQNPGISDIDLQRELNTAMNEWWEKETNTKSGRYRLDDILEIRRTRNAREANKFTAEQRSRFKNLVEGKSARPFGSAAPSGVPLPQDFTDQTPSTYRSEYNGLRGDKVFEQDDVEEYRDQMLKGEVSDELTRAADALGVTPLSLLQQQLLAYGLKPVKPYVPSRTSTSISSPISAVEGAQKLMSMGFPAKGSAWLAGNIQQESSWVGNRPAWQDGINKAGGLISWNGPRLAAIEARFGRPITDITNEQQLQYMVQELKQPRFAEANRIFRNPFATDRQLIRASKDFWGYGHEGARYEYARELEQQIN